MKSILIRGPLLTQSGYGVHSRQIFRWALESGFDVYVQVLPWGMTCWYTEPSACDGLIGEIMRRSAPPPSRPDVSVQIQLPNEWDPNLATVNIGVSAVVETNVCNPTWVQNCYNMDHVIVPSEFAKQVLLSSGHTGQNLSVVSEAFYDGCIEKNETFDLGNVKTRNNFLLVGQITGNQLVDRKNIGNTITWFLDHYKEKKDVGLIIKTNLGSNSSIDRAKTKNSLKEIVSKLRQGSFPKVYLIHGRLTENEISSLYKHKKVKALISATRGEGFGLPLLEASASGLPVVATNWSGHLDFLRLSDNFYPIEYDLKTVPNERIDNQIFMQGSKWAEPRRNSFLKACDEVLKTKKSKCVNKRVIDNFSMQAIKDQYNKILGEYLYD